MMPMGQGPIVPSMVGGRARLRWVARHRLEELERAFDAFARNPSSEAYARLRRRAFKWSELPGWARRAVR